jgi:hypothetical protein
MKKNLSPWRCGISEIAKCPFQRMVSLISELWPTRWAKANMPGVNALKKTVPLFPVFISVVITVSASAQQDVRGIRLRNDATRVFDEKCLGCHNRKLIDEAVKERRDINQILKEMEKKGVFLTDKEKKAIGHFSGQKVFKAD